MSHDGVDAHLDPESPSNRSVVNVRGLCRQEEESDSNTEPTPCNVADLVLSTTGHVSSGCSGLYWSECSSVGSHPSDDS